MVTDMARASNASEEFTGQLDEIRSECAALTWKLPQPLRIINQACLCGVLTMTPVQKASGSPIEHATTLSRSSASAKQR